MALLRACASHAWRGGLSVLLLPLLFSCILVGRVHALSPGRFQFAQPVYSTTEDFGVAYITGKTAPPLLESTSVVYLL